MKKKNVAGIFALCFGVFGLHRFYLGQRFLGVIYMVAFIFGIVLAVEEGVPIVAIPAVVSFIDAMLLFAMPKGDFDNKYNKKAMARQDSYRSHSADDYALRTYSSKNPYKMSGIEKFRDFDIEGALEEFKKSLDLKYDDKATHFNLACCYSFLEETDPAFFHLSKAVEFGFVNFDKIYEHDSLAFLRSSPRFDEFARNGYRYEKNNALPAPKEDLLASTPAPEVTAKEDLLDQIMRLGELRENGILTEEEFAEQKKKLLE